MPSRPVRALAAVAFVGVVVLATSAFAHGRRGDLPNHRSATRYGGVPYVGAIFAQGLGHQHSCTASVVLARHGGLVLTAAHCISGTAAGLVFAPGYVDGTAPYGTWTVERAWVSPQWTKDQDPRADYAFLEVAPKTIDGRRRHLSSVTGGEVLGTTPDAGTGVTVAAYDPSDEPIVCTSPVRRQQGYPTFHCDGYPGGTSGSPFLVQSGGPAELVVGVIGGLLQGGCTDAVSFSSPFDDATLATYQRAVSRAPADTVPKAGPSGC